jgi:hypothetical protein
MVVCETKEDMGPTLSTPRGRLNAV